MYRKRSLMTTMLVAAALALVGAAANAGQPDPSHWSIAAALSDPSVWLGLSALGTITSPTLRALQEQKAKEIDAMRALQNKATSENRDFTEEELKAYEAHKARATSLNAAIDRENVLLAEEAAMAKPAAAAPAARPAAGDAGVVVLGANATITATDHNTDKDAKRGFKTLGDFARSVHHATLVVRSAGAVGAMDPRLLALGGHKAVHEGMQAAAPSTFGSENSGSDGGFLIPAGFSTTLWKLSLEEDALMNMTDRLPIEGTGMSFPKDETTPWGSNGVRAFWQSEATAGTPTKPIFGRAELKLKKLMALVPMSDELMADATALGAYLGPNMARSIRWKTDEAILFGGGNGLPLGLFNAQAPSFITVSKESAQATLTLLPANCAKMIARLMPGSYGRAVWLVNNDVLPALFTMTLGNYPIYLPSGAIPGMQTNPYGTLLGRPIIVTQHAKSFSSLGDIMLVDFSWYQTIEKAGGIETATSMHLYFDADAVAFRSTFRIDGQPKLASAVSPANGSNTLSPFVQLEAR